MLLQLQPFRLITSVRLSASTVEFGLELHPEKTLLIEFGRFAVENRKTRGEGKPGDVHVPGFHALLRENQGGKVHGYTEDDAPEVA